MSRPGTDDGAATSTTQPISRDHARDALAAMPRSPLDDGATRYATALAGFGVLIGVCVMVARSVGAAGWQGLLISAATFVPVFALALWQSRTTRAYPRGARRLGWIALGATLVASIGFGMVLNSHYRDQTPPPGPVLVLGLITAAPLLVAAGIVLLRARR